MASLRPLSCDPSRLPAYRSAHVGRFHPYPRGGPRRSEDSLMQTVDYRTVHPATELATIPEEPEAIYLDVPDGDVSSLELDYPTVGSARTFDQGVRTEENDIGEKVKMVVVHLLVALRRRSLAILAMTVASFSKGERRMKYLPTLELSPLSQVVLLLLSCFPL